MSDSIIIPATYIGTPDAELVVELEENGESYAMTLYHADGHVIAAAGEFRPGAGTDFGAHNANETASTFGAFLSHAIDWGSEGWDVIAYDADDWVDALMLMEMGEEESEES